MKFKVIDAKTGLTPTRADLDLIVQEDWWARGLAPGDTYEWYIPAFGNRRNTDRLALADSRGNIALAPKGQFKVQREEV